MTRPKPVNYVWIFTAVYVAIATYVILMNWIHGFSVDQINWACHRDQGVQQFVPTVYTPPEHTRGVVVCRDGRAVGIR